MGTCDITVSQNAHYPRSIIHAHLMIPSFHHPRPALLVTHYLSTLKKKLLPFTQHSQSQKAAFPLTISTPLHSTPLWHSCCESIITLPCQALSFSTSYRLVSGGTYPTPLKYALFFTKTSILYQPQIF
ncbi:hypothetical protein KC19_3G249700 [Ceratodon purpureus]|uniref:Uncharacterized protein n=1 Tax=Ceratodon purpureus TaxID=3225 RepID=A0A8T0IPN5_CERPU|nr:hypothetical protein KC19_3G249700 [Ceratodon purpureus]